MRIAEPTHGSRYGTALDDAMRDFERAVVRIKDDARAHFSEAAIAELLLDVVKWRVQKALVAVRIEPPPGVGLTVMAADADGTYRY